jgi:UDP-N-acetylglucosamine acyltransferase
VRIGDGNVFREHVTVHRANTPEEDTVVGSNNFIMASAHVAHNCQVGNNVIIANSGVLGGHVTVEDRAFISGNCSVHQFVRVGTLAMMQGNSALSKDLPPFTIVMHVNELVGLNVVGLRRAGFSQAERLELRKVYHTLFRNDQNLRVAIAEARTKYTAAPSQAFLDFVVNSKRGVCMDISRMEDESEGEAH